MTKETVYVTNLSASCCLKNRHMTRQQGSRVELNTVLVRTEISASIVNVGRCSIKPQAQIAKHKRRSKVGMKRIEKTPNSCHVRTSPPDTDTDTEMK